MSTKYARLEVKLAVSLDQNLTNPSPLVIFTPVDSTPVTVLDVYENAIASAGSTITLPFTSIGTLVVKNEDPSTATRKVVISWTDTTPTANSVTLPAGQVVVLPYVDLGASAAFKLTASGGVIPCHVIFYGL